MERKIARWQAQIQCRTNKRIVTVEYHFSEFGELQEFIEIGFGWERISEIKAVREKEAPRTKTRH